MDFGIWRMLRSHIGYLGIWTYGIDHKALQNHPYWKLAFLGPQMWLHLSQGFPTCSFHIGEHKSYLSTIGSS